VNWDHLRAIAWLRWHLLRNQQIRAGLASRIVTAVLLGLDLLVSIGLFVAALWIGSYLLPRATPIQVLWMWNVAIGQLLFFWLVGVMTELQRSEPLSFQKLLYFPISLSGTFLVNYLASFVSITLITFVPAMVGLCIASTVAMGPAALVTFLLLAGLILMVTAVTYQFRGWIGVLMANKRRRRTLIMLITLGTVLFFQIPNLVNVYFQRSRIERRQAAAEEREEQIAKLGRMLDSHQITPHQARERIDALERELTEDRRRSAQATDEEINTWAQRIDLVLPPGWMAIGAMEAAEHRVWPGLLGSLAFFAIAGASLRRSYRTTLAFYRGEHEPGRAKKQETLPQPVGPHGEKIDRRATLLVERGIPGVPDEAAATALATLRGLIRAPEFKMVLLSPLFLGVAYASMLTTRRRFDLPETWWSWAALGVVMMETLGLVQIFQNQFGFDRDGFRAFVLSPARRRDILLGKNLALAPLALGIGLVVLSAFQFMFPLRATHFIATFIQLIAAYLMLCMVGNQTSILLPSAVRAGSLRASKRTNLLSLLRLAATLGLMAAAALLFVPLLVERLLESFALVERFPVYLLLSAVDLGLLLAMYRLLLGYQGAIFQSREQKILDAVTQTND
jgi:ABC-2 type transport system permease protein